MKILELIGNKGSWQWSALTCEPRPKDAGFLLPTHFSAAGKKRPLVIAAIAREMAAFLWASRNKSRPPHDREPEAMRTW